MRLALLALVGLVLACSVATASPSEPPAQTIKRLRAENARLRFQNRNLLANIDVLFKRIDLLNNEITDCLLKEVKDGNTARA